MTPDTYDVENYEDADFPDFETQEGPCPFCEHPEIRFRRCDVIGCDEGFLDLYDEDPINYSPGEEYEQCQACHGTGIVRWCPNCGADLNRPAGTDDPDEDEGPF